MSIIAVYFLIILSISCSFQINWVDDCIYYIQNRSTFLYDFKSFKNSSSVRHGKKIKRLCDQCGPHVRKLHLEELKCCDEGSSQTSTRIPLNAILTGLPNLQEVSICFKQKNVGIDNFTWNVVQLPSPDIKLLSKGLEKIRLQILRIYNSDIRGKNCTPIIKALMKYDNLRTLDFSYCNVGDHGATVICKFVLEVKIKELLLVDNNIGKKGAEAVAYNLNDPQCSLEVMNLRLNPLGSKGGNMILTSLLHNKNLKSLNLAACNIKVDKIISEIPERCPILEELILANNPIGEEIGNIILNSLTFNKNLRKLDLRMCQIHSELQQKISERLKDRATSKTLSFIDTENNGSQLEFSEEFKLYFDNILLSEESYRKNVEETVE